MTILTLPEGFDLDKFVTPPVASTLTWYPDRVESVEPLSPEDEATLQAALDAYDPAIFDRRQKAELLIRARANTIAAEQLFGEGEISQEILEEYQARENQLKQIKAKNKPG